MLVLLSLLLMLYTDILLPHSPAKQQGGTASCWAFSMCSYWETEEAISKADSPICHELSPWYLARIKMLENCKDKMISGFAKPHKLPNGAMAQTAIKIRQKHGIVRLSDYQVADRGQGKNFRMMRRAMNILTWIGQYTIMLRPLCLKMIEWLLDLRWGKLPSPGAVLQQEFPEPVFYTSFSHLPMQQDVLLPLPDNYEQWKLRNIPLDSLIEMMVQTLQSGHSLLWQGSIRRGFSMQKGVAILPSSISLTEQHRSDCFLHGKITDDHMMHLIGLAHDENGKRFFFAKNSVGDSGPYHGLIYMSEDYIRFYTIAVGM